MRIITVSEKISKKFNKFVKKIYIDYRNNVMHMYTNPRTIDVFGNSALYPDSIVVPKDTLKKRGVILTRVNALSELVGIYILSKEQLYNCSRIISKKYVESVGIGENVIETVKYVYFLQVDFNKIESTSSNLLYKLVCEKF